ncbi:MAG: hypothetical protein HC797_01635 [Anaerolineales bacterium]|nr:hypothetical protein [Anaerolineales bacterium]
MDFLKLIQSLEDLLYEFIVWALLLPKTLIRATFRPDWMVSYVNQQWDKKPEEQYDEYITPGLFFIAMAVLPSALLTWAQNMEFDLLQSLTQINENNLITSALTTLISILIYLIWLKWLNKHTIKRSGLKRLFMIQCYLVTPPQLIYILLIVLGWGELGSVSVSLAGTALLVFYESFAFKDEMKVSWWKGLWYAAIPYLAFFVVAILIVVALGLV